MGQRTEGTLRRNDCDRWEFSEVELTSGSIVEICIDGHWIEGVIEHWRDAYYWFSRQDSIPLILRTGIKARLPEQRERSRIQL